MVVVVAFAAGGIIGVATSAGAGLEGHKVRFEAASPDADTVCVNYYETRKDGSAKNVADIDLTTYELQPVPWKVTVPTGRRCGSGAWPSGRRMTARARMTRRARSPAASESTARSRIARP